ncbi:MAG: DNA polymerase III subunit psi [Enterobacterales bacterium]
MNLKNEIILKYMGIERYTLKERYILKKNKFLKNINEYYFIIISDPFPLEQYTIVTDVIISLQIMLSQVKQLTFDEIKIFSYNIYCNCWWINYSPIKTFKGISIYTPSLNILINNINAKRNLWNQIYKQTRT